MSKVRAFFYEHAPDWFCRLRIKVRNFIYSIKSFWQRGKHGYSDLDTYDIDVWFVHVMSRMLRQFKGFKNSYPEGYGSVQTMEDWQNVLNEMIACLENMDEEKVILDVGPSDEEDFMVDFEKVDQIMEDNKDRFFELFSKYFYCLWD